jgi:hypothetical protein
MLCDLAEKLMRSGREAQARPLWDRARAQFPDDVWVYVQGGIEYSDLGEHATALTWLTPGVELALRTGDVESALEQLTPLRAGCLPRAPESQARSPFRHVPPSAANGVSVGALAGTPRGSRRGCDRRC